MEHQHSPYGRGRKTRQRDAVAVAAASMLRAFSVDELIAALRGNAGEACSSATVYRAVAAMESNGFLEKVGTRDGAALYALCTDSGHHHHIVCDGCGKTVAAPCQIAHMESDVDGFVVTRHEMTLYGLCRECAEKGGS